MYVGAEHGPSLCVDSVPGWQNIIGPCDNNMNTTTSQIDSRVDDYLFIRVLAQPVIVFHIFLNHSCPLPPTN